MFTTLPYLLNYVYFYSGRRCKTSVLLVFIIFPLFSAFNLASFCIKKGCLEDWCAEPAATKGEESSGSTSHGWVLSGDNKQHLMGIVDAYVGLLYKLKREQLDFLPMVCISNISTPLCICLK